MRQPYNLPGLTHADTRIVIALASIILIGHAIGLYSHVQSLNAAPTQQEAYSCR